MLLNKTLAHRDGLYYRGGEEQNNSSVVNIHQMVNQAVVKLSQPPTGINKKGVCHNMGNSLIPGGEQDMEE